MTTSCRQVLVHLDASRAAPLRLAAARGIAQQLGAALAALYATAPVYLALPYAPDGASGVAAALLDAEREARTAARRQFDAAMKAPGPVATWAEAGDVPLVPGVAEQAWYVDLLVLGQRDPSDPGDPMVPPDFVEAVVMASGRPALVIPYTGAASDIGGTVAIAWKPTREAARAVAASLPLLRQAAQVHVLGWDGEEPADIGGHRLDLDGYLRLHGVEATWHRGGPEPESLGELLLSRVFDLGADLLVMGCYGHSRAREWVLGGTTRTVLRSMTVPVLMAH